MNGCSTSKVEASHDERPAIGVPCPASNCVVDNRGPDKNEDHERTQAGALRSCTNSENGSDVNFNIRVQFEYKSITYVMAANMSW